MSLNQDEVINYLSNLSVIDLVNLTKALEDKWGVKAAPVAVAAPAGGAAGGGAAAAPAEEKTEFTVVLKSGGANKIGVIKVVREITGLGLKDAKDMVDGAPKEVKAGVSKADSDEMAKKLKEAGAEVESSNRGPSLVVGTFGGFETVTLRSGATVTCSEHGVGLELRPPHGEAQLLELDVADGNFGGSEVVISPDETFAAVFYYSGQSEVGYQLFALEPALRHIGGLPYVFGEGVVPRFSPSGEWLVMAVATAYRVRDTGVPIESAFDEYADGDLLVDWATLFVQRIPDGQVEPCAIGMYVPANSDPDCVFDWNTYEALSFVGPDRIRFVSPTGPSVEADLPLTSPLTLMPD